MTPFKTGMYWSFSYPSGTGGCHGSITPTTSTAGSPQVTSSRWQPTGSFSPIPPQTMDTLSTEQAAEIYQLAAEYQALGSKLARQFQNLEAVHHTGAQATAHETINAGCMACSTTFGVATATQTDEEHESSLFRVCAKANKAQKDANEVIFSHLLKYDTQLAAFISTVKGTLQAKHDEIWRCIYSLADTVNIPHRICLPLAFQTLDQLPAIPWDLSYHAGIPLMFAYGPESYDFQTWSNAGGGEYLLDNNAWATNLLPTSWRIWLMGWDQTTRVQSELPHQLAQPCPPLQHIHHPDPAPELPFATLKRKGLALALHPAPIPRRPNPSPRLPQMVKAAMMATRHPKRATSLRKKIRQTLMAEPKMTAKAQMVTALTRKALVAVAKLPMLMLTKTWTVKLMNPAVRLKSQMLKAAPALQNLMTKTPTKATPPARKTSGSNPNTSQILSLPDLDSKDPKEEWKFRGAKMPAS